MPRTMAAPPPAQVWPLALLVPRLLEESPGPHQHPAQPGPRSQVAASEAHCRQLGAFLGHKGVTMPSPPHLIRPDGGSHRCAVCRPKIGSQHLMMMILIR